MNPFAALTGTVTAPPWNGEVRRHSLIDKRGGKPRKAKPVPRVRKPATWTPWATLNNHNTAALGQAAKCWGLLKGGA